MTPEQLRNVLPGIQLAVFEVLWPIPGLERMLIRATEHQCDVRFESSNELSAEDREACTRLMTEILDMAFEGERDMQKNLSFGSTMPDEGTFELFMSSAIFSRIAAEVAPWRVSGADGDQ